MQTNETEITKSTWQSAMQTSSQPLAHCRDGACNPAPKLGNPGVVANGTLETKAAGFPRVHDANLQPASNLL